PESHAASFALLVYASAFLKRHYPAPFYAALLNNQPLGFYHPATLVKDAERHGVQMLPIDINVSDWDCTVVQAEADTSPEAAVAALDGLPFFPARGVRLGLRYVSGLRAEVGRQMERERRQAAFRSLEDLRRRSGLSREEIRTLAEVGALAGLAPAPAPGAAGRRWGRRAALWQVERAWRASGPLLETTAEQAGVFPDRDREERDGEERDVAASRSELGPGDSDRREGVSPLREMNAWERMRADYHGTGLTLGPHPMALRRAELQEAHVVTASDLRQLPGGGRVRVAGTVIARQRPSTAGGILFASLEDETGIVNVIVLQELYERQRRLCSTAAGLWVEGRLEKHEGVIHVRAERLAELNTVRVRSYDFR
ncbi:MAG: helix-hairpin-helix domain-containing protein, partial [Terriglobales bacterium]